MIRSFASQPMKSGPMSDRFLNILLPSTWRHNAVLLVTLIISGTWLLSLWLLDQAALLLPVGLAVAALIIWFLLEAMHGRIWALALMTAIALIVPNINFVERDLTETTGLDAQKGLKLALWLAMGLIAAARWPRFKPLLHDPLVCSMLIFGCLATLSTLWSPTPAYTAAGGLSLLASLMFCLTVAHDMPDDVFYKTMIVSSALYLLINASVALLVPQLAWAAAQSDEMSYRLTGIASHPNVLAKEIASFLCLCVPLALGRAHKRLALILAVTGLLAIILTGSRTSLIAILLAFFVPWLMSKGLSLKPLFISAVALCGLLLIGLASGLLSRPDHLLNVLSRGGDTSEILTMTGRTELWGFVWDKIMEAPLLGHGFNTAHTVLGRDWWGQPDAAVGAHNMWLQSLLTLGLIGTIPFAYWHLHIVAHGLSNRPLLSRMIGIYILVLGLAEVGIAAHPSLLTYAAFLAMAHDARLAATRPLHTHQAGRSHHAKY
jgi:O-antigen ligase